MQRKTSDSTVMGSQQKGCLRCGNIPNANCRIGGGCELINVYLQTILFCNFTGNNEIFIWMINNFCNLLCVPFQNSNNLLCVFIKNSCIPIIATCQNFTGIGAMHIQRQNTRNRSGMQTLKTYKKTLPLSLLFLPVFITHRM